MTTLAYQLIAAAEREDIGLDDEPKPGEVVKFSACSCDDGEHRYADRDGWQDTRQSAASDLLGLKRTDAHLVRRTVAVVR